ncbi:hypothetical protein B0O80DRAFT_132535 [Mortierella sp. GBAus27b]|nr:hypothetical protein BGX31_010252 [Mortierella sp. GBA43]KAI8350193.1 hypothetical protein B0O80DRAFT_132535 [Mortierella sp. GBAus27b]
MDSKPSNALELPEIRQRVSRFLSVREAIVCARVCKDWTDDFVSAIWHTLDARIPVLLGQDIISKHGHRIRVIKNLANGSLIDQLQNESVSKLKSLSIDIEARSRYLAHCSDLIQRSINTLSTISISWPSEVGDSFFNIDCLSAHAHTGATSKLTHLKLSGVQMTRNSFSRLLRICPSLDCLELTNITLQSIVFTDKYQHPSLSRLIAPIEQAFKVDPAFVGAPSLLVHLPGLRQWETWQASRTLDIKSDAIYRELAQHCPLINSIRARDGGLALSVVLVHGFRNLKEICIPHKHLNPELVMAITVHKDTLTTIMATKDPEPTTLAPVTDHLEASAWAVQFIPAHCQRLKRFSFRSHEMHMDDVERFSWMCHDLEELHVRIKDLNTEDLIHQALQMWTDGKRLRKSGLGGGDKNKEPTTTNALPSDSSSVVDTASQRDVPIDVRVARHLLQFKKLQLVWLGTRVWKA